MSRSSHTQLAFAFRSELRLVRLERGMTQANLAESLGVPQSYVSKLESGERRIDFIETLEICGALGITVSELVTRMEKAAKAQRRISVRKATSR